MRAGESLDEVSRAGEKLVTLAVPRLGVEEVAGHDAGGIINGARGVRAADREHGQRGGRVTELNVCQPFRREDGIVCQAECAVRLPLNRIRFA